MGTQSKNKNSPTQKCFIPLVKNKVERAQFDTNIEDWINKYFQKLSLYKSENQVNQFFEAQNEGLIKKLCQQIQSKLMIKYSIQNMLLELPLEYYNYLIHYVAQKKLYWIFKPNQASEQDAQISKKNLEIQWALQLKRIYKNFQFNKSEFTHRKNLSNPTQIVNQESFLKTQSKKQKQSKKMSSNFQYQLLVMYSVSVMSVFFSDFFPEVSIDKSLKSQIYIIINHAFLDIQVSPSVYDVMKKKFCVEESYKNFKNMNASYVHELSEMQHQRNYEKKSSNQHSKKTINDDKMKSILTFSNDLQKDQIEDKRMASTGSKTISLKGLSSTVGFSTFNLGKSMNKKDRMIKPTSSIDSCLQSQRQGKVQGKNTLGNTSISNSRFQSFLKDTKKLTISPIMEDNSESGYLPTAQEYQFYETIKKCLHVDSLPPIIKKKININQFEKMNEMEKLKEIKKQVKSLDLKSKKNHIKSNDLSLAMNTFISFSCGPFMKKRKSRNKQIVTHFLQSPKIDIQNHKNRNKIHSKSNDRQKQKAELEDFQLRKLPLKPAHLKFQYQKSSNIYQFNDMIPSLAEAFLEKSKQKLPRQASSKILFSTRKTNEEIKKDREKQEKNIEINLHQKKKKSTTEWKQFIKTLKNNQFKDDIVTLRQNQRKIEKRRNLYKPFMEISHENSDNITNSKVENSLKSYFLKQRKSADFMHIINQMQSKYENTFLAIPQSNGHRDSMINNKDLSNKLQLYELGQKEVSQIEQNSQHPIGHEDSSKYSSLEGQVNVHKDISTNYECQYKSFQLKKKLKKFEAHCKEREEKSLYSIFNIKGYRQPKHLFDQYEDSKENFEFKQ